MSSAAGPGRAWQRLRALPGRTPLRVKLITAVLELVAIALAVISIAGISVLRSYLLNQDDNALQGSIGSAEHYVEQYVGGALPRSSPGAAGGWVPSGGKPQGVIEPVKPAYGFTSLTGPNPPPVPGPQVSASPAWLAANLGHYVTVPAQSGGGHWRVFLEATTFVTPDGGAITGTVIVGLDVTSVYNTIGRLVSLDLIVSAVLLFALLIIGIAVVRASLRPLTDIEKTAEPIAAGDLTRRVPMCQQATRALPRRALDRWPGPTWTGSCCASSRSQRGWASWSRTCCCSPGWTSSGRWSSAPSTC